MRLNFFENTVQSKFIKSLLESKYIPIMNTVSDGDLVVEGIVYATNQLIIKCTKSGILGKTASYKPIKKYSFGEYIPKYTERFTNRTNIYDADTHRWLGRYLRCLRDFQGIDLMPFYNVMTNEFISNITINPEEITSYINNTVKTYKIPIKFNKPYLIALDCLSEVRIAPVFLTGDNFLVMRGATRDDDQDVTDLFIQEHNFILFFSSMLFNQPQEITISTQNKDFMRFEKNLYLLIQIPAVVNTSLVVLEGDYFLKGCDTTIVNAEYFDTFSRMKDEDTNTLYTVGMSDASLNSTLLSNLSLLQFNSKKSYPFADRLIEYLLHNVIDSTDIVKLDIQYMQKNVTDPYSKKVLSGIWNLYTRFRAFEAELQNKKINHLDLNGFGDKAFEGEFKS